MTQHFTKQQIQEIEQALTLKSKKDTSFTPASALGGDEQFAIVQDRENRLLSLNDFKRYIIDQIDDALVVFNYTSYWDAHPEYIPQLGAIIIYLDYKTYTKNNQQIVVPGFKVGDGQTSVVTLPFSDDVLANDLLNHKSNTTVHITSGERENWNNKYDKPSTGIPASDIAEGVIPDELSDLSEDSAHRTVTDTEKSTWNAKSDFSGSYNDLTDKPTIPDELSDLSDDADHRLVTDAEKSSWSAKYNKPSGGIPSSDMTEGVQQSLDRADSAYQKPGSGIPGTDLESAVQTSLGKADTAYQKPSGGIPKTDLDSGVQESLGKADSSATQSEMDSVTSKIPSQASAQNQLADKEFVNSSIATATATHRGTYNLVSDLSLTTSATEQQIAAAIATKLAALSITADNNDYVFVQIPTADATPSEIERVDRYKYNGSAWGFEFSLNNSGFTAAQWAAINSGITDALVSAFNAKYDKPSGGIPKSDMDAGVQSSLDKADSALQEHQDISGKANKSEMSVTDGTGANADKTTIQLKTGTSATVLKSHQDISGKQDVIQDLDTIRSGAAAGAIAYQKPSSGIPASDLASGVIPDVSNFITRSVNDLVNYYLKSETYTKSEVQALIAAIQQFHYEVYASTSEVTDPASNVLYLIGPTGSGADKYEEYVWPNSTLGFVKIGDTSISGITNAQIDALFE